MDMAEEIALRLKQILSRLKLLKIVHSYTIKIEFGKIEGDLKDCLIEVSGLLRKCVKKIRPKPRPAEIRNVIGVLVRKKNIRRLKGSRTKRRKRRVSDHEITRQIVFEERYLCEFCGVKFFNYTNLKVHIMKNHRSTVKLKPPKNVWICTAVDKQEGSLTQHSEDVVDAPFGQQSRGTDSATIQLPADIPSGGTDDATSEFPPDLPHHGTESVSIRLPADPPSHSTESATIRLPADPPSHSTQTLPIEVPPQQSKATKPGLTGHKQRKLPKEKKKAETNSFPCPYSGCQNIFQKRSSMRKHIRVKHGTKVEYQCSKCDKVFFEKGKLNRHILTHQPFEFQCTKCHKGFHRMDNLRRHVALHVENVKAFQCRFCKKTFSLKFNRDAHESNVHTKTVIHCGFCDKQCKNEATLKVHMRLHDENRISCSLCCKTFTRKAQYQNHLKNKHKGVSPFQKLFDTFATLESTSP